MKKIITLVLAVALLMTSVMAFAETKGTPNINSFAKMTTKTDEAAGIITITMSKMVDRLLVNWVNKGAEPEELAYVVTALADERARYLIGADILCAGGCVNNGYGMLTATKRYDGRSLNENW